jgi:hypothetical protein
MVNWKIAPPSDEAWDAALARTPGANIFQASAWARHKADFGWRPIRLLAGEPEAPAAAIQALVKNLPGGGRMLWSRGGPAGDPALWNGELSSALAAAAGGLFSYGRICSFREAPATPGADWSRPDRPLNRNMTALLDLVPEPEALKANLTTNWRHNLKRGIARSPLVDWPNADPAEMEAIYRELESLKSLAPQHRRDELASMMRALGPALVLKRAVVDGRTVAFRACAVFGDCATDLLAAATVEARKVYASYALLWDLLLESRRRGAKTYDMSGADPVGAPGVTDFKLGAGGRLIETVGEWDFARPALLRRPVGALIAWKLGAGA